jgi:hypothetical protein
MSGTPTTAGYRNADAVALRCQAFENVGSRRRRPIFSSWRFLQPTTERTRLDEVAEAPERIGCVEGRPSFIPATAEGYTFIVVVCLGGVGEGLRELIS